ncbi:hypothetical protein ACFE04_024770 [Oxalis oulophora]
MHQHNFPGATNLPHPETNPHFVPSLTQYQPPQLEDGEDHYPLHLGPWGSPPNPQPRQQPHPQTPILQPQQNPRQQQPTSSQWDPREREREPRRKGKKITRIQTLVPQPFPYDQQPPKPDPDPRFAAPPSHYQGQYPSDRPPPRVGSTPRVTLPPDNHGQLPIHQIPPMVRPIPTMVPPQLHPVELPPTVGFTPTLVPPQHHPVEHPPMVGFAPTMMPPRQHQGEHPSGVRPTPPQGSVVPKKREHKRDHKPQRQSPSLVSPDHRHSRHREHDDLLIPKQQKTKCITWCAALICAIFWILVILGGLIVLIIYLVFRPRSPRFDVSSATLNAAYLDMGILLNADLRVLANFTNPNKRVSVEFSYVTLDLNFGNVLIATQYVKPFKAARAQSLFADVHMVTSQVRLSPQASELLKRQMANNRVHFEVRGIFHARSTLGNFLGYSYKLYSICNIELTGPPTGVLRSSKCRTKR